MLAETQKHSEHPLKRVEYSTFELTRLTPHIGAEIRGLDLSKALSAEESRELDAAFQDWMVLVFRDQAISRDEHKAFGRRFGRLHSHPMHKVGMRGEDPEILPVITTPDSAYTAGDGWHTDVTCDAIPPKCSILRIHETPGGGGGDTLFANMVLAYELLSDPMKEFLSGLSAVHDGALPYVGAYKAKTPEGGFAKTEHPVVTVHPESGARVLYVNSGFTTHIKGLTSPESRRVLDLLFDHIATTPRLHCRVQWEPDTMTLWDNRCTQHHAVWDYYPECRRGERVSVLDTVAPACL
jgi:taurine dioxygenase